MERKFKEMSMENIQIMMEDLKKKMKSGNDPRDAGILLALEFELDIRKNEEKFVNESQVNRLKEAADKLYDDLLAVDMVTISSDKVLPALILLREKLQQTEAYITKNINERQKISIIDK